MIEHLKGIHETVQYQKDRQVLLHLNQEAENYPPHWHLPFELIMPTQNGYHVTCGGEEFFLEETDILLICPGVIHELYAPEKGSRLIFQAKLSSSESRELNLLSSLLSPAVHITRREQPGIYEQLYPLLLCLREECTSSMPYSGTFAYASFLQILGVLGRNYGELLLRNFSETQNNPKEYMEKFLWVTNYICEHFKEALTLEEIAAMAGFSKYHFSRLFHQYAGTTFYRYLNQRRIAHARALLLNPDLTVTEVALQSGFPSISSFLRMFRLLNGCTPTEYRKLYR